MDDPDTHYCLRCRTTIQGLNNYVLHRSEKCPPQRSDHHSLVPIYLGAARGSSSTLLTRTYLDPSYKPKQSDPILSSSSDHSQGGGVQSHSLVHDLSVEAASADDFMSTLGLCMVSTNTWASDINIHSEEPLRADDFFSLLELQSCKGAEASVSRQRPRRSTEPIDLNSSHDSTAIDLAVAEVEMADNAVAYVPSPVPPADALHGDMSAPHIGSEFTLTERVGDVSPEMPDTKFPRFPASRGKWMPGLIPRGIQKSGSSVEYHCKPCNRRLTGRAVFEKHLQSELHFKRCARQLTLQQAAKPYGLRQAKRKENEANEATPAVIDVLQEDTNDTWWLNKGRKKTGERDTRRCPICSVWIPCHVFGKHLVSRYHVARSANHPHRNQCVLDNIHLIVIEAPFSCLLCRFFCHSHGDLLAHWRSDEHSNKNRRTVAQRRTFHCSLCRIGQLDQDAMSLHLHSEQHLSCVDIVNKSVPVIINKLSDPFRCRLCPPERDSSFRYRLQLNRHMKSEHLHSADSLTDGSDRAFTCEYCSYTSPSRAAFTHHRFKCRQAPADAANRYQCLICSKSWATKEEVQKHRSTQEHRDNSRARRTDGARLRTCPHCYRPFENLSGLKEHFLTEHPDLLPSCSRCGASFALKQELSVHRRTNCQLNEIHHETAFSCDVCPYRCRIKTDLLYHRAVEHPPAAPSSLKLSDSGTPKYQCPDCGQSYGSKFSLKAHLKSQHAASELALAFRCHHCGRRFGREEDLLAHIRQLHSTHADIKSKTMPGAKAKKKKKTTTMTRHSTTAGPLSSPTPSVHASAPLVHLASSPAR